MTMVELQQPRLLIPRVDGRDVRVLVDHPYVYLRCEDVESFAGIPPWGTGETLLLDDDQVVPIGSAQYYPLEVAMRRAQYESLEPAAAEAFLAWAREQLPTLLAPEVLEAAHRIPGFASAYTVAAAARLLNEDAEISTGRDRLFEFMAEIGWIERNTTGADTWVPTHFATSRDLLTTRVVEVGPRKSGRRYLQIHVTNAGIAELRRKLAGTAPRAAAIAHPTLFD